MEVDVFVVLVNEEWVFIVNVDDDVFLFVVIEWYGEVGGIGCGFVCGFGLEWGVVGLMVVYDVYNCIVVGVDYDLMVIVVNYFWDVGGGVVVYDLEDDVLLLLVFLMGGLMLDELLGIVKEMFELVEVIVDDFGFDCDGGLMVLLFFVFEVILMY